MFGEAKWRRDACQVLIEPGATRWQPAMESHGAMGETAQRGEAERAGLWGVLGDCDMT